MIRSLEFELLQLCCRKKFDPQREARMEALLQAVPDWEPLLRLARHHGMLPLLHHRLETQGWRGVPADRAASLKAAYRAHLIRNLEMAKQLFLLLDLLARHSLRALPVKGPVLAAQAHGDIGLRAFADLDLLVAPEDFWECHCLLRDAGFTPGIELDPRAARLYAAQETSMGFYNRGKNLTVELHWNFLPCCFGQRYDFDALWDGRRSVRLERRAVAALSDSDTMRYLLLHGFKHGWDRLCLVSDAAYAAAALRVSWEEIQNADPAMTMIDSGSLLIAALVDDIIPKETVARARRDRAARRLAEGFTIHLTAQPPAARTIFSLGGLYVAGQQGFIDKTRFLWRLLFEATAEDWKRRHFSRAFWRYTVLRPWRLLADHVFTPGT